VDLLDSSDEEESPEWKKQGERDKEEIVSSAKQAEVDISEIRSTHQSKLAALASAEDEWAAWGKDDDSEDTKQLSKSNNVCFDTLAHHDDGSSSDEEGATFLTLAPCNIKQTSIKADESNLLDNTGSAASNADMESVDWEDGNSEDPAINEDVVTREANSESELVAIDETTDSEQCCNASISEEDNQNENHSQDKSSSIQSDVKLDHSCHNNVQGEAASAETEQKQDTAEDPSDDVSPKAKSDTSDAVSRLASHHDAPLNNECSSLQQEDIDGYFSDEEVYINEFDTPQPENPNLAALQHAQETASKLADWAGRAVQRAFASHLEQQNNKSSPQERPKTKDNEVDLTSKAPTPNKSAIKSPPNDNIQRHVDFLDTSIEGLNAAHHAILEEEKLMERDMSTITDEMKEDILTLLQLCGIPWIESPAEAEAQCAALEGM
jgi:DNA excision repair protein ERCC-5